MPANSPSLRRAVARHAGLTRTRPADDPAVRSARREIDVESLTAHIRRVVDQAPPLTADQRSRIAALLRRPGAA